MGEGLTFWAVLGIAVTTAFVHTITGPDHYLPFIVLARSRHWSLKKTFLLTFVSGIGHLASALVLALFFDRLGDYFSEKNLEIVENLRGSLAAWMLAVLGLVYLAWGIFRLYKKKEHTHPHVHADGTVHQHPHTATDTHRHLHGDNQHRLLLGWSLFIIFVLGPCEALLPILAAASMVSGLCVVSSAALFSGVTIISMLLAVGIGYYGTSKLTSPVMERYSHILAGGVIAFCGLGMIFFGL